MNSILKKILALLLAIQYSTVRGENITSAPRFDTSIPFPKSSDCGPTSRYGIDDFSSQGYCAVGMGVYTYDSPVGSLPPGSYTVVFLRNPSTGDQVAYHVTANSNNPSAFQFEGTLLKPDGTQIQVSGQGSNPNGFIGELGNFMDSPQGQAVLSGVLKGILHGQQLAAEAEANGRAQVQEFSISGKAQVQILAKVKQEHSNQILGLGELLAPILLKASSAGKTGTLVIDSTFKKNIGQDILNAAVYGNDAEFLEKSEFLFDHAPNFIFEENEQITKEGLLKYVGAPRFVSKLPEGKISTNGIALTTMRGQNASREWVTGQKLYHMRGMTSEFNGRMDEARRNYRISSELAKISAGIPMRSRLSFGKDNELLLNSKSDLKGLYFDPSTKEKVLQSALKPFKIAVDNRLSKEEAKMLAAQREYAEILQKSVPQVGNAFKIVNQLLSYSDMELTKNNMVLALIAGDFALSALDLLSNFTWVGDGESIVNILTGNNLRTGQPLTEEEIFQQVLGLIASRWPMSDKISPENLKRIIKSINPKLESSVEKVLSDVDRLREYVPDYLAKNRDALAKTIQVIKKSTPDGQDWIEKSKTILDASKRLKGFDLKSLSEIIEHRRLLISIRDSYKSEVRAIEKLIEQGRQQGKPIGEIAKEAHAMRRQIGEKYKNLTPESLRRDIYRRNIETYGDELGPSFEYLVTRGRDAGASPENTFNGIIKTSTQTNSGLNVFLEILAREL